jgi:hypothetical protein
MKWRAAILAVAAQPFKNHAKFSATFHSSGCCGRDARAPFEQHVEKTG